MQNSLTYQVTEIPCVPWSRDKLIMATDNVKCGLMWTVDTKEKKEKKMLVLYKRPLGQPPSLHDKGHLSPPFNLQNLASFISNNPALRLPTRKASIKAWSSECFNLKSEWWPPYFKRRETRSCTHTRTHCAQHLVWTSLICKSVKEIW